MKHAIKIIGHGMVFPQNEVISDLNNQNNITTPISSKYGVNKRYWAVEETNSSLAAQAIEIAMQRADINYETIDLIIYASATYDYPLPATACMIPQHLNKAHLNIPCIDVNSSCLSFVSALEIASVFISTQHYNRIIVVSSEIPSKSLDKDNIETYSLFGDGAACFILEKSFDNKSFMFDFQFRTYPQGALYTCVPAGGNIMHPKTNPDHVLFNFRMEGSKVLKFTIEKMNDFIEEYKAKTNKNLKDFEYIIPHQASRLSLDYLKKKFELKNNQVHDILANYGNCIAASIPISFCDAIDKGIIKRGSEVLLLGTASGITIGAARIIY